MSFSSGQWTIVELCVWITTQSKVAVNSLSDWDLRSLKLAESTHAGTYAARDDVVAAARAGRIVINSSTGVVPVDFWIDGAIVDWHSSWMADYWPKVVARRVDRTGEEYDSLWVSSGEALAEWPARPAGASDPAAAASASSRKEHLRGARRGAVVETDDREILAAMRKREAEIGGRFTVRAFVLENERDIAGPSIDAKIRRLQRKYDTQES